MAQLSCPHSIHVNESVNTRMQAFLTILSDFSANQALLSPFLKQQYALDFRKTEFRTSDLSFSRPEFDRKLEQTENSYYDCHAQKRNKFTDLRKKGQFC